MSIERIRRVKVKGFKSLRDLDLELEPFTVLVGANGSGKSNLIDFFQMLNWAFGSTEGNLQSFIARRGRASSLLYYGPQVTPSLDAEIVFDGENQWSRYAFSLGWGAPDDLFYTRELLEFQSDCDPAPRSTQLGSGSAESKVLAVADRGEDDWQRKVARIFRHRLRQIRAWHFHDTGEMASVRLTQDLTRDDYLMNNGGNLAVVLHNLMENKPACYHRILGTIQLIVPFLKDFVLTPEATDSRFVMLRWRDRSGEVFGPHQLSDGSIRAIALVTALLQPDETLPSVMFFDEPELGLHPSAIGLVADLLKAASLKRQVIVATQSPLLIRGYVPEDVVVVERVEEDRGRGESRFHRLETAALEAWLEEFDLGDLFEKNITSGYPR